ESGSHAEAAERRAECAEPRRKITAALIATRCGSVSREGRAAADFPCGSRHAPTPLGKRMSFIPTKSRPPGSIVKRQAHLRAGRDLLRQPRRPYLASASPRRPI